MIKVTYLTHISGASKPERTIIDIFNGKIFTRYDVPSKAENVVKQMRHDGRIGVLYSRGAMIQVFSGKSEDEILEVVKKDIENGVEVAKKKSGKEVTITDLVIEKNE